MCTCVVCMCCVVGRWVAELRVRVAIVSCANIAGANMASHTAVGITRPRPAHGTTEGLRRRWTGAAAPRPPRRILPSPAVQAVLQGHLSRRRSAGAWDGSVRNLCQSDACRGAAARAAAGKVAQRSAAREANLPARRGGFQRAEGGKGFDGFRQLEPLFDHLTAGKNVELLIWGMNQDDPVRVDQELSLSSRWTRSTGP